MYSRHQYIEEEQWVIWNGTLGILDTVAIGEIEVGPDGRSAWLDEPYDMVGPFSLDELESSGEIAFAACVVMSREKWRTDQVQLRLKARQLRREAQERMYEEFARYNERRQKAHNQGSRSQFSFQQRGNDRQHREVLKLPAEGSLKATQIKAAYRKLAQKFHPDAGGSQEQFVEITVARDALLERAS
ncbi:J domain-containing protein [Pseudomaricurvus sp. HS19]|uniref:J domain-containing protein n=1 Tax=Pseudomaricurvus sp. HS19 TaxID=2692626 RepID=UPI00136D919C|nr:J domain-containing protein [Pseudomaricurvus sp. HS19]MYM64883.1 DnaJ domain-containing protein [Pseudomaricurvus sp. HS19]